MQINVTIAVVSHGHLDIVRKLDCLPELVKAGFSVVLLDNLDDKELKSYCVDNRVIYISNQTKLGFGENNNKIFEYCSKNSLLKEDGFFLVLNPDVCVSPQTILDMIKSAENEKLSTINLSRENGEHDLSIRKFPTFFNFVTSILGMGNSSVINKEQITEKQYVDWAAGSFLLFSNELFRALNGFDTRYFMYCEDVDICWRAMNQCQTKVAYFPDLKAIHYAQHANRAIFSNHFKWHIKSAVRFLLVKSGLLKAQGIN